MYFRWHLETTPKVYDIPRGLEPPPGLLHQGRLPGETRQLLRGSSVESCRVLREHLACPMEGEAGEGLGGPVPPFRHYRDISHRGVSRYSQKLPSEVQSGPHGSLQTVAGILGGPAGQDLGGPGPSKEQAPARSPVRTVYHCARIGAWLCPLCNSERASQAGHQGRSPSSPRLFVYNRGLSRFALLSYYMAADVYRRAIEAR